MDYTLSQNDSDFNQRINRTMDGEYSSPDHPKFAVMPKQTFTPPTPPILKAENPIAKRRSFEFISSK